VQAHSKKKEKTLMTLATMVLADISLTGLLWWLIVGKR
jgi:hypothetical protein